MRFVCFRAGYTFQQRVWQINGFGLDSLVADEQVNLTLHVQVCRNFAPPPPGCEDVGALYIVSIFFIWCVAISAYEPHMSLEAARLVIVQIGICAYSV